MPLLYLDLEELFSQFEGLKDERRQGVGDPQGSPSGKMLPRSGENLVLLVRVASL